MLLLLRKPACLRAKNSRIHTCFCYFLLLLETLLKKKYGRERQKYNNKTYKCAKNTKYTIEA